MPLDNKVVPVVWLRTQFNYDEHTGIITNAPGRKGAKPGGEPCYPIARGYLALKVHYKGVRYTFMAQRLAWALHTGEHPAHEVDHKDLNRKHNWFTNFRIATRAQNNAARAVKKRDLPKGVSIIARNKLRPFRAQFSVGGKTKHLGCFATADAAADAYKTAAMHTFGEFARF